MMGVGASDGCGHDSCDEDECGHGHGSHSDASGKATQHVCAAQTVFQLGLAIPMLIRLLNKGIAMFGTNMHQVSESGRVILLVLLLQEKMAKEMQQQKRLGLERTRKAMGSLMMALQTWCSQPATHLPLPSCWPLLSPRGRPSLCLKSS